jgi:hypothetical protein
VENAGGPEPEITNKPTDSPSQVETVSQNSVVDDADGPADSSKVLLLPLISV